MLGLTRSMAALAIVLALVLHAALLACGSDESQDSTV